MVVLEHKSLDGQEVLTSTVDLDELKVAKELLAKLKQSLHRVHGPKDVMLNKSFNLGMLAGVEAYLGMLSRDLK